jgi:2,4-dienoyl-CoA reductase-like NADH-dependent reductase (Old Yellow Enzyme family)
MPNNLFDHLKIRGLELRNRIVVSPMCQYSSKDGYATDWHLVHLGSRAVGRAGLVIAEASAVEARGRITPGDLGIYKDEHVPVLARIAKFVKEQGAGAGIQLAHAGRKASCNVPWVKRGAQLPLEEGGWQPVAPSDTPFHPGDRESAALTIDEIHGLTEAFAAAAKRALAAGFQVVEIHGAHGYLIHEFLSPLANQRTDEYGGSFHNRIRFALDVSKAVRAVWPDDLPVFLRISASDWAEGGWDIDQSVELARCVKPIGIDLIDCSSGGMVPNAKIEVGPGYQVPFSKRIRYETGMLTGAVGMITEPDQADAIIREGDADVVLLAREFLRHPYWPLEAAAALGVKLGPPVQYERAFN